MTNRRQFLLTIVRTESSVHAYFDKEWVSSFPVALGQDPDDVLLSLLHHLVDSDFDQLLSVEAPDAPEPCDHIVGYNDDAVGPWVIDNDAPVRLSDLADDDLRYSGDVVVWRFCPLCGVEHGYTNTTPEEQWAYRLAKD